MPPPTIGLASPASGLALPPPTPPPPPGFQSGIPPPPPKNFINTPRKQPTTKTMFLDVIRKVDANSIWVCASDVSAELVELRQRFMKKEKAATPAFKKCALVSCVDGTRERNVGIVLKCLRLREDEIKEAIEEMDSDTLSEEAVAGLLSIFPTADEQKRVLSASVEQKQSACCRFFEMCASSPHLEQQLRCWLSMIRFDGSCQQLLRGLMDVTKACIDSVESIFLREILRKLLALSNELNKDLPSLSAAQGFRVTDLPKFKNLTFSDFDAGNHNSSKHNLLHFALGTLTHDECNVGIVSLRDSLQSACKVDLPSLRDELKELSGHVSFVKSVASSKPCPHYTSFLDASTSSLLRLSMAERAMNDEIERCSKYFEFREGEWSESLSSLTQFIFDIVKCW